MSVVGGTSPPRRSRTRQRARRHAPDEARREIEESATRFLWERPFRELTVSELMAATSLSRPAFYQYFTDLHDLIKALFNNVEEIAHETAHPWLEGEGEPIAALLESQIGVIQTCIDYGPILRAVAEAAPLDTRLETLWADFNRRWDDVVEARIRQQQKGGLIANSLDAGRIANALNTMDTTVLIAQYGRRPQGNPNSTLRTLHTVWVRTLYGQNPKPPNRVRSFRTT